MRDCLMHNVRDAHAAWLGEPSSRGARSALCRRCSVSKTTSPRLIRRAEDLAVLRLTGVRSAIDRWTSRALSNRLNDAREVSEQAVAVVDETPPMRRDRWA